MGAGEFPRRIYGGGSLNPAGRSDVLAVSNFRKYYITEIEFTIRKLYFIMPLYIICTLSKTGRYVNTATRSRKRAEIAAAHVARGLTADGWSLEQIQDVDEKEPAGVPAVVQVYHLSNTGGRWFNVELYAVAEG